MEINDDRVMRRDFTLSIFCLIFKLSTEQFFDMIFE